MQRPDEKKRQMIANTAARLFASRPFHKVKLDDVAAEAGVGKGTLYVYFKSKEELYLSLIFDGFSSLVARLKSQLATENLTPRVAMRRIISELVRFGFEHPQLFELMRTAGPALIDNRWEKKRREFVALVEATIIRGNQKQGGCEAEFCDPHPEMTALFIVGLMRSVMLFGPKGLNERNVEMQIIRFVENGICAPVKTLARGRKGGGRSGVMSGVRA